MLQAIAHRGPDGLGHWQDERGAACLYHARLALVDLVGGAQPMTDASGDLVIAFNGEIYDFRRTREKLEAQGALFRTRSDTELLLHLYSRHGPDFLSMIEGEFAFVLFDRRRGQALLARDPFGVKPLFVAQWNGLLLFGSEAKAILAHPWAERRLDMTNLYRRLSGAFLPQDTLFAGVSAIEPGSYMLASRQGLATRRYADLDPEAAGTSGLGLEESVEAMEPLFRAAVSKRFHGDRPVGLFLSGGVDSNSIAAYSGTTRAHSSATAVPAFSIDFKDSADSERDAASLAARRFHLRPIAKEVATRDLENGFEKSIWHAETIAPNTHGTAKMLLAGRARLDVRAVLTGEGADELQGGYAYFEHAALLQAAAEGRSSASAQALSGFLAAHGPSDGVLPAITPEVRRQLAWSHSGGAPYAAMRARVAERGTRLLTSAGFRDQAQGDPARALLDWLSVRMPSAKRLEDTALSRLVSLLSDLPAYNLSSLGDRVEMANGLEARVPFLDRALADFLWRTPSSVHHGDGQGKRVLRALLARHLPDRAKRPKRPFLTPGAMSFGLLTGRLAQRWLSGDAVRQAGIFRAAPLSLARLLLPKLARNPRLAFYSTSYLTMAMSTHLVIEMFCERFSENLRLRSALSLEEIRRRLAGVAERQRAVA
jgi:asparagine synthase (glutamine-hydrolysing)